MPEPREPRLPPDPDDAGPPGPLPEWLDPARLERLATGMYRDAAVGPEADPAPRTDPEPAARPEGRDRAAEPGLAASPAHVSPGGLQADRDLRRLLRDVVSPYAARPRAGPEQGATATPRYYFLADPAPSSGVANPLRDFDVEAVRREFPILEQQVHGRPLVWLDNAATTQKPFCVIDAVAEFYRRHNSNVHRAAHALAAVATDAYEEARERARQLLGAASAREIVFVRGATEAINLVAQSYGRQRIAEGDEIVVTALEHHSNLVPWQLLARERGAKLRVAPIDERGEVLLEAYERLLGPRTRLVAIAHASNVLGTVLPVRTMIELAHRHGARVLVDGAQAVPHLPVDVRALGSDFYVFSGHKLFGPTGIGVLYGREALLEQMPPWQGGGNMIDTVDFEESTFAAPPARFEAGTAALAQAVGLGAAIDFVQRLGLDRIARYEAELTEHATRALTEIPGLRLIGTARHKVGVFSFVVDGIRSEELASFLDRQGIAVRAGHHCAQPAVRHFGVAGTVRASLAFYNTRAEIDALAAAVRGAIRAAAPTA